MKRFVLAALSVLMLVGFVFSAPASASQYEPTPRGPVRICCAWIERSGNQYLYLKFLSPLE